MDSETLLEVATSVKRLKMFPYFDVAHYLLMCLTVKEDAYPPQFTGRSATIRIVLIIASLAVHWAQLCRYMHSDSASPKHV